MVELTQDEFTALFAEYPAIRTDDSGAPICPYCSNALSPESIDLMNGSTEDGTPYCNVEITCDVCGKDIWRGGSWHGDAISHEEHVGCIEDALFQADWESEPLTFTQGTLLHW
jgi:hypothetical protein